MPLRAVVTGDLPSRGMGHTYGYARVSTLDQDPALQVDALEAAGCERILVDRASGKLDHRPQLDLLRETVLAGDTVIVWRLDRLGRSMPHLLEVVGELGQRSVAFRSLTEAIDTTTAGGRLLFHVMGALAEFEHQLIVERTCAGLAAARARGRTGGRRRVMSDDQVRVARQMRDLGDYSTQAIADALGVSRRSIYRYLATV